MYEIESFAVTPRIVLSKTPAERAKTVVRDGLLALGIDFHGWRAVKAAFAAPTNIKGYEISENELDEAKIRELAAYAHGRAADYVAVLEPISDASVGETVQYTTVPLMEKLIASDGRIKSVVDLGCYSARVLGILPPRHPDIHWDFVDFMDDVADINRAYAGPNTRFISNYPLHQLRAAEGRYDIAHFNRVLALTGREEIRSYLRALADKARYIVFGEPAKILGMPGDLCLEDHPDFVQFPGYRAYNYRKLMGEFGFELLHYDAVRTSARFSGEQHFIIRGVARNSRC